MQPFAQRSRAGWIGVPKRVVIVQRALSIQQSAGRQSFTGTGVLSSRVVGKGLPTYGLWERALPAISGASNRSHSHQTG
jgi:hypothetical protein